MNSYYLFTTFDEMPSNSDDDNVRTYESYLVKHIRLK